METLLRSSDVPICPAAPRARHGAGELSVERQNWHCEPGDGDSPAARPAGGNAPAGSRKTRSPPSAELRRSAPTWSELAGRQRQETDLELVSLLMSSPWIAGLAWAWRLAYVKGGGGG